jgi:cell division protein FtsW (lipid II flippase)
VVLILVEPDRGSTILLAAVSAAMLLIAGVQWKFLCRRLCSASPRWPFRSGAIRCA